MEISPDDTDLWINLGITYGKLKNYNEEIKCYKKTLELDVNDAETWINLGIAYSNQEEYEDAIYCFRRALDIAPDNTDVKELYKSAIELR